MLSFQKKKTSGFFISIFFLVNIIAVSAQDTLNITLNIRVGIDIANPVRSFINDDITGLEGYISYDLNEKLAPVFEAGFIDFKYSQYNYNYSAKGTFFRLGVDLNSMKPKTAIGKYYAGIGVRYGVTFFNQEVKGLQHENYWSISTADIPSRNYSAHFLEVLPGIRAEVFTNFSMGWTVRLKMLIHSGTGKDLRPVYLPGFGNAGKTFTQGFNYYLIWSIPYKNRIVITKPPVVEETAE